MDHEGGWTTKDTKGAKDTKRAFVSSVAQELAQRCESDAAVVKKG